MAKVINLTALKLKELLDKKQAIVIDVREPAEYRSGNIEGAINNPLSYVSLETCHLPEHKGKKIVLHCLSGKRSMLACEKLLGEGIRDNVYNLEGGISAWKAAEYPIKKEGNSNILPLDRQTQVTIGILILLGSIFGHFIHYSWFVLPAFIGLGLINAGVTGWCGMAKLIAKMPWNK